ncbi:glycine/D-amino acid oxidase-like deaminating enzyme [Tepidamorphus gemmatus]|uniref:Glycine/D-amino acid oxidase-like deaminating enzyme n=1 Tax=Tepidamorphus gemmatus TaxID=747076 RepID=A0A4R3M5V2_9HYPH|nr:FAD-binding oxidoreductase [Tepidamorphus gemmatus]TCT08412.1 glycine/D-amino acid oxidase-like deaminating enzyme [Tepidamorphus gemmatus]
MRHLYHPAASDPATPVDSYWAATAPPLTIAAAPLESDESCDVAIIGGGYTGLSAALHLARDHGIDVRVLERAEPGWGASGRNGGFCCIGGAKVSYRVLIGRHGLDEVRRFFAAQRAAVELVGEIADAEGLDIDRTGSGDLEIAHRANRIRDLEAHRDFMRETFGVSCRLIAKPDLAANGCSNAEAEAALELPFGFGLHPLKFARGLAAAAARHGARLHGHSPVEAWQTADGLHRLSTPGGTLRARRVVVATNGYTPEDLHPGLAGRLLPALSNVLTTRPLRPQELAVQGWTTSTMAYDSRNLLHYFRLLPDGSFLFGARGGVDASPDSLAAMRANLTRQFHRMFPAWQGVEITHFWRGFVCLARDLVPHVGRLPDDPSVIHAFAYHGNGVSMGTWSGRAAAELAVGRRPDREIVPAVMGAPLRRFPLPGLRPLYLRAAYAGFWVKDEIL